MGEESVPPVGGISSVPEPLPQSQLASHQHQRGWGRELKPWGGGRRTVCDKWVNILGEKLELEGGASVPLIRDVWRVVEGATLQLGKKIYNLTTQRPSRSHSLSLYPSIYLCLSITTMCVCGSVCVCVCVCMPMCVCVCHSLGVKYLCIGLKDDFVALMRGHV